MPGKFGNYFAPKTPPKGGPVPPQPAGSPPRGNPLERKLPVFAKVFRWRLPDGQTQEPATVEIVGSFTQWQKVPLHRTTARDGWQVTLNDIPSNRTNHYMLLVDGQPVRDKHCDGLAVPHGPQEEQYQLLTDRGPRVLMLFAQSK